MDRIVVQSQVGSDCVLQLTVPLGPADADRPVQVTIEPARTPELSVEEWRRRVLETAGKWQGDFERPPQGEYESREPLA